MISEANQKHRLTYRNWMVLALLPVLTIVIPALLGHPPILGDNATQNISLRWLVGQDYRAGHLPTWDPFNWDGTPLLAGFNAGALYPLMVFFVLLPASAAMTVTLSLCWLIAEVVTLKIAETIGINRWFAIAAGALFVGTGAFTAQVVHIDMIEGDLASLVAILFLMRLFDAPTRPQRIANAAGLATAFACAVFAGAPEAMLASVVALGVLFVVKLAYRALRPSTIGLTFLAAVVALGLSAPQWLTGLAYTALSNRAHLPAQYAGFGPFGYRFFPLILFPFAYGGYSGGYLPNYFGNYNPSEITIAITSVGLVFAIIGIATRHLPTIQPWAKSFLITLMIVAALLALGSETPVATIVYHLPLFSLQRLASRYIIDVDLAGVLLAAAGAQYYWNDGKPKPLSRSVTYLLALLGLITVAVGASIVLAPVTFFKFVDANSTPTHTALLEIRLYIIVETIVMLVVLGTLWARRSRSTPSAKNSGASPYSNRWIRNVLISVLVFDMLGMAVQFVVLPAFYEPAGNPAAPSASQLIHGSERYGLYDPNLYLYDRAIVANEQLDRNVFTHTDSIQGYASLTLASYNDLTHTKTQSTLDPALIPFYHQRLNMDLLITSRRYFRLPVQTLKPSVLANNGARPLLHADEPSTFYVGNIRAARSVLLHPGSGVHSLKVTATSVGGQSFVDLRTVVHSDGWATVELPSAFSSQLLASLIVVSHSHLTRTRPIDVVVTTPSTDLEVAGPLVNHLNPLKWRTFQGKFSSLDFVSTHPTAGYLRSSSTITVLSQTQTTDGTLTARLKTTRPGVITSTLAYAPGWEARTDTGATVSVHNDHGLLAIDVPQGTGGLTLSYSAPHLRDALALGAISLLLLVGLLGYAWFDRQRTI
ncbi:hypothetical protein [Ferrimicrobium sp.]|uniref:hypothetical protein n=1 Tax=Ferrimicrobium sp. TaxID=2926050 RepID=UPI0026084354|nr:hypothetical protein [Ferrimicrobium sp.]